MKVFTYLLLVFVCFSCSEECKRCEVKVYDNRLSQLEKSSEEFIYSYTTSTYDACGDNLEETEKNEIGKDFLADEIEESYLYLDTLTNEIMQGTFKYVQIHRITCE